MKYGSDVYRHGDIRCVAARFVIASPGYKKKRKKSAVMRLKKTRQ